MVGKFSISRGIVDGISSHAEGLLGYDDNLLLRHEVVFYYILGDSFIRDNYDVGLSDNPACGVIDSMPYIPSFCDIQLGENMFRDARSYFNSLTRNAEAFSQITSRLKDTIFLTDEELYSVICSHISKEYSVKTPSQLSVQQKIDTARQMHFDYNATNQQLRRMLRMDLSILEELFP